MRNAKSSLAVAQQFQSRTAEESIAGSARERADMHEQWVEFVSRHAFICKLSHFSMDAGFRIEARSRTVGGFTIARFATIAGKSQLIRGPAEIDHDAQERYVAYMSMRGNIDITQRGRAQTCRPFTLVLVSASEPMSNTKLGDNDTIDLLMPRGFVDQRLLAWPDSRMRSIEGKEGLGRLVLHTLATFQRDSAKMSDAEFQSAAYLMGELVVLALSGCSEVMSCERTVRSANLARVKSVVRARCSDSDFTLGDIAEACGLSLSYVHNLFRDDGRTFWEFLKSERLQRARRLLESPSRPGMTITEVSLASGFPNMSQFSTAFKRAFGMCPKDALRGRYDASHSLPAPRTFSGLQENTPRNIRNSRGKARAVASS